MNILNQSVKHKAWGVGKIIELNGNIMSIDFKGTTKKLQYPEAFEKFLVFEDDTFQNEAQELIDDKKKEDDEKKIVLEKKIKQLSQTRNKKTNSLKGNIAIKCIYCDGGQSDKNVGFNGVCSEENIKINIEANRVWCNNSKCKSYYKEEITYDELLDIYKETGFVCYESVMLRDLTVGAGVNQSKKKSGVPRKFREVRNSGLLVYTTRLPGASEKERIIFAISVIDDYFEGDSREEGKITGSEKYTIKLSLEEAKQVKFWDYYFNANNPTSIQFSTGLFRYLDNQQALQVIQRMGEVKTDNFDTCTPQELLEYYGNINNLDIKNISKPNGPLLRKEEVKAKK